MSEPTRCPHWCSVVEPHRANHFRQVHRAEVTGGRLSVDLHQAFDHPPEVVVFLHGSQLTGESFTPAQALHLSAVLSACGHDDMVALGGKLGAAAVICEEGQS